MDDEHFNSIVAGSEYLNRPRRSLQDMVLEDVLRRLKTQQFELVTAEVIDIAHRFKRS